MMAAEMSSRPRGRPRVYEADDVRTDIQIPARIYSRLHRLARQRGVSVSQLVRAWLIARFSAEKIDHS